jgi:hypothetical protein
MGVRTTVYLAAAAVLVTPAPAVAQASNDVKCLLVSNLFSKASKDAKARQVAEVSKYYYLGRVYGRLSEAQLKAQIVALQKTVTTANAGPTMNGCARAMQAAASAIQRVSQQSAPRK